jgi:hypothetical protein
VAQAVGPEFKTPVWQKKERKDEQMLSIKENDKWDLIKMSEASVCPIHMLC